MHPLLLELFAPGRAGVDALAVDNAAAALLLALDTLANGRPVAVSRGELVAIGGDFRVPSILAQSGATLLEVGTTNRTTPDDYREALDAGAGAVLKVRPSNYRIVGFTEEVALADLAALARARGVPLVYDAGAGAPRRFDEPGLSGEPVPLDALEAGADLVCFSGDKVLGGPQAGILLGQRGARRARREESARAGAPAGQARPRRARRDARPPSRGPERRGPVLPDARRAARRAPAAGRGARGEGARAAGFDAEAVASTAIAGGGAGAESTLPSAAVALRTRALSADALAAALRARRSARRRANRGGPRPPRPAQRRGRRGRGASRRRSSRGRYFLLTGTPGSGAPTGTVRPRQRPRSGRSDGNGRVRDARERDVVDFPEVRVSR